MMITVYLLKSADVCLPWTAITSSVSIQLTNTDIAEMNNFTWMQLITKYETYLLNNLNTKKKTVNGCDIFFKANLEQIISSVIGKDMKVGFERDMNIGLVLKNSTSKNNTPQDVKSVNRDQSTTNSGSSSALDEPTTLSPPTTRRAFNRSIDNASTSSASDHIEKICGTEHILNQFTAGQKLLIDIKEWTNKEKMKKESDVSGDLIQGSVSLQFMETAIARSRAIGLLKFADNDNVSGTANIFKSIDDSTYAVLTNYHVLPPTDMKYSPFIRLDFSIEGEEEWLDVRLCDNIHVYDKDLDFSFVSIDTEFTEQLNRRNFKPFKFSDMPDKLFRFQGMNVISHPRGQPSAFSIRGLNYLESCDNLRLSDLPKIMQHGAYTLKGSSGALVCDDNWQPVALHFQAGDDYEIDGKSQKVDHTTKTGRSEYVIGRDDPDSKLVVSNEAVPIDRIYAMIMAKGYTDW